jgi:hypothetical protein
MRLNNKDRIYSLYVYNNKNDAVRTNSFYETKEEILKDLEEIRTENTWLNKMYKNKYKYYYIIDTETKGTIQMLISKLKEHKEI